MRQLILDLLPETAPSLDNFVAGANGETLAALAAWLDPAHRESSLYLWGEAGAGKTHLLRASGLIYHDAAADPDLSGGNACTGEHAVDHVEALSGAGQIALFNLFNRLRDTGGKLLTAGRLPPRELALREDLRTRLGYGLICRLQTLTDDERFAALSAQAEARGLRLPPEILGYLLTRAPRDMRSLAALLAALDRYSLEHKRPITLPLLRDVLHAPPTTASCTEP
jgi:DnaA family protein